MFSVLLVSMLAVEPNFSSSLEHPFLSRQTLSLAKTTVDWDAWKADQSRMAWWLEHGWQILDGTKAGTPLLAAADANLIETNGFNPLDLNVRPSAEQHQYWSVSGDRTLHLISLTRCEVLYQRHLVNQAASKLDHRR